MRNNTLIIVASILAVCVAAPLCHATPSCCDPTKAAAGPAQFSPSPRMLQAAPVAPVLPQMNAQPVRANAVNAQQPRWNAAAAAHGFASNNETTPGNVSGIPPCCAQAQPAYAAPQAGCCGGMAPQAAPAAGGCCGRCSAPGTPAPGSCCRGAGAGSVAAPQGCCSPGTRGCGAAPRAGCCGQARVGASMPGQSVGQAPASCCSPGKGATPRVSGVNGLPAAIPIVNPAGYSGPTAAGPIRRSTRVIQQSVGSPSNRPVPVEPVSSSFSYAQPRGLW